MIDIVGIGASRSGSTWLASCLKEHPEICFSSRKELHFFNNKENFEQYERYLAPYFSHCESSMQKKAEYTPGYLANEDALQRIYDYNPKVKIIITLRNPITRAYSEFFYNNARNLEKYTDFYQEIKFNGQKYISRGMYGTQLKKVFSIFERDQVFVTFHDDIEKKPEDVIKRLCMFLEISTDFRPSKINTVINNSPVKQSLQKNKFLGELLRFGSKSDKKLVTLTKKVLKKINLLHIAHLINAWNQKTEVSVERKPSMDQEAFVHLRNVFEEDIKKTEVILKKDLSVWREKYED